LRSHARALCRDHSAADDLVQETILRALAAEAQWQVDTALRPWLFTIQRHAFFAALRRRRREARHAAEAAAPSPSRQPDTLALRDLAAATDLRFVALRYFNVAGSDPQGRIGQSTRKATLLVKVACEASVGKRTHVSVYGSDYDTPDGTGVRDYIHVADLARAHLHAVDYLRQGGGSEVLNCGYGHGYSVRDVLRSVERVSGKPLVVREEPRRAGDPPSLVAQADRIRQVLGWTPALDDLDGIVASSLRWEEKLASSPW
jgi:UDP-glucose 4-epimerase